ncbi:MAG: TrmH family RNA methyltransferase [Spirochaetales bacterium]|nr:TrmH family RNA methyltransferase [Spirochaetales bacterium]
MFTLGKLKSLPPGTRIRKLILILHKAETDLLQGKEIDENYLQSLILGCEEDFPGTLRDYVHMYTQQLSSGYSLRRYLNMIRQSLLRSIGSEPSEWDFILPGKENLDRNKRTIMPIKVFLEDIRSPYNVGSIFRTAESFGVSHIYISDQTPSPEHKRARKTARGCIDVLPWSVSSLSEIENEEGIFALEIGNTPIEEFHFPSSGIVLIGSEELGLSPEALALAQKGSGCVSIPMAGAKRSLNVSIAFGILMYYWYSQLR